MARIYKKTDRIKVKIDDVTLLLAPLSVDQKTEFLTNIAMGTIKSDYPMLQKGIVNAVKCGVKSIEGVTDSDENPYKLKFENDMLTDECIDDLFNLEIGERLKAVCQSLLVSIPKEFVDAKGNKIEGVELLPSKSEDKQNPN